MKGTKYFKRILCVILSCLFLATSFAAVSVSAEDTEYGGVAYKVEASDIDMTGTGDNFVVDPIWNSVPALEFGQLEAGYSASGTAKFLWDGSNLYMLAEFKDSERSVGDATILNNDCLEVRLYCNGSANGQWFRFTRDGATTGTWPNKLGSGVEVVYKDTAEGWTAKYKLGLNWAEVSGGSKVYVAKQLNLYVIYNDGSDGAPVGQLQLMGGKNLIKLSDEKVEVVNVNISGASISVGTDLTMNYYVDVISGNVSQDQLSMRFTMNDTVETVTDSKIVDGEYVFAFDGIAPQQMCDNISAELLLNGDVIATQATNSVKSNAQALLNTYKDDTTEKGIATVRFVTNMLYYGAAAQEYANYNVEALATDSVENMVSKAETTPNDSDKFVLVGNTDSTLKIASASCLFDNVNKLCFKFYVGEGKADTLTITVGGKTVALSDCEDLGNGYYRFMTDAIYATDLDRAVVVVLNDGTNDVSTLTYSVNSYAYSMMNSTNTEMVELAMALYRYGMSADAYNAAN